MFVTLNFAVIAMFGNEVYSQKKAVPTNETHSEILIGNLTDKSGNLPASSFIPIYDIKSVAFDDPIPTGSNAEKTVGCNDPDDASGYEIYGMPIGGGFKSSSNFVYAYEDRPVENNNRAGWKVILHNNGTIEADATIYVACIPLVIKR